jgi:hypothetical protein
MLFKSGAVYQTVKNILVVSVPKFLSVHAVSSPFRIIIEKSISCMFFLITAGAVCDIIKREEDLH